MIQLGGASLETPAAGSADTTETDLCELLATVSDDTDIKRTISCSDDGIQYDPDEGEATRIAASTDAMLTVTHRAVYVVPQALESGTEIIETIPFTEIDDAQSSGLVRRKLTITTTEGTYRIKVTGRPDLDGIARFLRRASWSWSRVAPRLETARTAITTLETQLNERGPDQLERDKHQAKMALSKARSSASRLDIAVDAIEAEIEHLRERLQYQRIRWHVLKGEDDAAQAKEKLSSGLAHAGQPRYEDARNHFEQALSIARTNDRAESKQVKRRLEEIRERLYDLEVEPVSESHEAVEQAIAAPNLETAIDHWEAARQGYEGALQEATDEAPIRYQLAWIVANLVRARRAYANQLEEDADNHAANGHDRWARQLYIAADDQLVSALSVARDQEYIETQPIETQHERLAAKHEDAEFEWPGQEATSD